MGPLPATLGTEVVDMRENHNVLVKYVLYFSIITITTNSNSAFAYDPYDCLNDIAEIDSGMTMGLGTRLCSGAWTAEPVKCYAGVSSIDNEIPRGIAVELCSGSVSAENTLKCYAKSGTRGLPRGLATRLCGARVAEDY